VHNFDIVIEDVSPLVPEDHEDDPKVPTSSCRVLVIQHGIGAWQYKLAEKTYEKHEHRTRDMRRD
jgi:hypothetical protein